MKTIVINERDYQRLIARHEDHFLDYKSKSISPAKIEKIAVAFANADGGEIYLGIKDEKEFLDPNKRWDGFTTIEKMNPFLQVLFNLTPSLTLKYDVIKKEEIEGYILCIVIEKSALVCKTSDGTVYQRYGAQSLPLRDPAKITELSFAKGATTFEDCIVSGVLLEQIVESIAMRGFLSEYSPATDSLEFLINQNLISYREWDIRTAAIMLFHDNPTAVMPRKCAAKIARYETREDDPEREHLKSTISLEGPLNRLISDTVNTVTEILSSISILTSGGMKKLNYPSEAIWETIVNAFIHRDYSISDDVQIQIYDNRIEILSPGRLPGYVRVENILEARYARNPKIVRTLNRYPNPPNKDMGEGLNTTFQKMKEFGLKAPIICEDGNYVKVVLPHIPLGTAAELILDYVNKNNVITNRIARELTGIKSENQVKLVFYRLRDQGLIERVSGLDGNKAAWRAVKNNV